MYSTHIRCQGKLLLPGCDEKVMQKAFLLYLSGSSGLLCSEVHSHII